MFRHTAVQFSGNASGWRTVVGPTATFRIRPTDRWGPVNPERRGRVRPRRVSVDEQLCRVVTDLLGKRWSPEQVAYQLRLQFPGQPGRHLCAESIYQAIYDPRVDLTRPAKHRRRRRQRRIQGLERRGRLNGMTMIADLGTQVFFCDAHRIPPPLVGISHGAGWRQCHSDRRIRCRRGTRRAA
jgi:hypothetical protein